MNKFILSLINPLNLFKAYLFHRKNAAYDKSAFDLELYLYSKILKNDMLHYGYFDDPGIQPEAISLQMVEDAQINYAEKLIACISNKQSPVLDVGCGMGGLSSLLLTKGFAVEALTPNQNQKTHIALKYPGLTCHHCKFEDLSTDKKFGTIINSESLQYISLPKAFEKAGSIILPKGRWIITDYFRIKNDGAARSPHALDDFIQKARDYGWRIVSSTDITPNVLPTLKLVHMYAIRFALPVAHFAFEKLRYKQGWLYYLTTALQTSITKKIGKELATIDPVQFVSDKKYMLFVLEKSST